MAAPRWAADRLAPVDPRTRLKVLEFDTCPWLWWLLRLCRQSPTSDLECVHICGVAVVAVRVGIRELRAKLASHLESVTPIEVTRHGRTIGLYVPFPQEGEQDERQRLLEAGRLIQAELERHGLTEEELSADFNAWRQRQHQP